MPIRMIMLIAMITIESMIIRRPLSPNLRLWLWLRLSKWTVARIIMVIVMHMCVPMGVSDN